MYNRGSPRAPHVYDADTVRRPPQSGELYDPNKGGRAPATKKGTYGMNDSVASRAHQYLARTLLALASLIEDNSSFLQRQRDRLGHPAGTDRRLR